MSLNPVFTSDCRLAKVRKTFFFFEVLNELDVRLTL